MNPLLTDLVNKVYIETNRPDYVEETLQKVLSSTLKMHSFDGSFFFKDIVSAEAVFDNAAYLQTIDTQVLPFYRNMAYARKWDDAYSASQQNPTILPPIFYEGGIPIGSNCAVSFFQPLDPRDILDGYGAEKQDVYYQIGSMLALKSATSFKRALFGWYAWPDINVDRYNSWIAREYPYAIIYDAASAIFQMIGKEEASRKYDHPQSGLIIAHTSALVKSNILVEGK